MRMLPFSSRISATALVPGAVLFSFLLHLCLSKHWLVLGQDKKGGNEEGKQH